MPGRSLPCACVLPHFTDREISHAFNVVVPIHILQGEVLGLVPSHSNGQCWPVYEQPGQHSGIHRKPLCPGAGGLVSQPLSARS